MASIWRHWRHRMSQYRVVAKRMKNMTIHYHHHIFVAENILHECYTVAILRLKLADECCPRLRLCMFWRVGSVWWLWKLICILAYVVLGILFGYGRWVFVVDPKDCPSRMASNLWYCEYIVCICTNALLTMNLAKNPYLIGYPVNAKLARTFHQILGTTFLRFLGWLFANHWSGFARLHCKGYAYCGLFAQYLSSNNLQCVTSHCASFVHRE